MLGQELGAVIQKLLVDFLLHGKLVIKQLFDRLFHLLKFSLSVRFLFIKLSDLILDGLNLLIVSSQLGTDFSFEPCFSLLGLGEAVHHFLVFLDFYACLVILYRNMRLSL